MSEERGMPVTRDEVFEALRAVPEPCSITMQRTPTDIVAMGLVESIVVEGSTVEVCLVLTDTACVHFNGMRDYVTSVLLTHDGIDSVSVTMSTSSLWTTDRMNPSKGPWRETPRTLQLQPVKKRAPETTQI